MKNLSQRMISFCWLGAMAYFFIVDMKLPLSHTIFDEYIRPLWVILFAVYGFIHGYKTFLLEPDKLLVFPARCVASALLVSLTFMLSVAILTNASFNFYVVSFFLLIPFLLGWLRFYKVFLLPTITFMPISSYWPRFIAMLWFGLTGMLLAFSVFKTGYEASYFLFATLLSIYLGFNYGYIILLLPSKGDSILKALMIGVIGGTYITIFVLAKVIGIVSLIMFPWIAIPFAIFGVIFSLLFYFLFTFFRKKSS